MHLQQEVDELADKVCDIILRLDTKSYIGK